MLRKKVRRTIFSNCSISKYSTRFTCICTIVSEIFTAQVYPVISIFYCDKYLHPLPSGKLTFSKIFLHRYSAIWKIRNGGLGKCKLYLQRLDSRVTAGLYLHRSRCRAVPLFDDVGQTDFETILTIFYSDFPTSNNLVHYICVKNIDLFYNNNNNNIYRYHKSV